MAETETHRDNPTPAPVHVQDKGGSSTMLWLLLLLAIAAGLWWMSRDTAGSASNAPAPALDGSASTLPAPVSDEGTAAVAATAPAKKATTSKRTPAVRRDREPQLIASSQVMPRYPAAALRSGETGTVTVEVDVDSKGVPTNVSIENRSGNRELDRAALSAVRNWRFQPALRDGKPVASAVQVPVAFVLEDERGARR